MKILCRHPLRQARAQHLPRVLILEDDVRFMPKHLSQHYFEQAFTELPHDWEMLFLGYYEADPSLRREYSRHLVRPGCPYDTHAYVVNASMYDSCIAALEAELEKGEGEMRAVDVVIAEDIAPRYKVFACKDNAVIQDEGMSSIVGHHVAGNYGKELAELHAEFS